MKRTAIAVSMCFGMVPSMAYALDWSLKTSEIETIELNDNQFLRAAPAASLGSYSTLNANAEALTGNSKFNLDADGSYRKFWGPGADGVPEALNYGFKARYELSEKGKFDREYLETNWRQQSTALALLNDLGVISNARGFIDRITATGGIDRSLTSRDTVSLMATSSQTSYEPSGGGTPLTDTLARGSWRHNYSSVTAFNVSSEFEQLNFQNSTNSQVQIYRNQLGVDLTFSPVLSFRGNAGAAYLSTVGGINPLASLGTAAQNTAGSSSLVDWIGDAALTYRMLKNTTLAITASQSIAPTIVGSLFKTDTIAASLNHTINAYSTLSFSASGTRSIATTTTDYASGSVTYGYNFTKDLTAQLTYRYQHRFASTGTVVIDPITGTPTVGGTGAASSNSIVLVVSHNYVVLPPGN